MGSESSHAEMLAEHNRLIEQARQKEREQAKESERKRRAKRTPRTEAFSNTGAAPERLGLEVTPFDLIQRKPVRWLWPGKIARGKVTLIAGDPGLGKSQITASLAAIVTRGDPWPAGGARCEPGAVLFLSAEDDPEDTMRPRLEAVGADLARCHCAGFVHDLDEQGGHRARAFSLKADLGRLAASLREIGNVSMVVIDPISAYLGNVDSHKTSDVRALLAPLTELAGAYGVAIVGVSHLNKSQAQDALQRVSGSLAFVAAARAAFIVAPDKARPSRRYLLPIKNNLGPDRVGYAFTVESTELPEGIQTSRIVWEEEPVTVTADEILAAPADFGARNELDEAKEWLAGYLADGSKTVKDIQDAAEGNAYSWRTVERAKRDLGVLAEKQKIKGTKSPPWVWMLPPNEEDRQP